MLEKIQKIIRHSVIISKHSAGSEPKPPIRLMFDLMRWTIMNRGYITNFFLLGLNQKNKNISDYLTFRSFKPLYHDFYPSSYLCLLEDKLIFEKFINNFPEHAPKNLGFVTRYHFYLPNGLPQPIENILKHPMKCIVKNTWGFGGRDIFLLTVEDGQLYINGRKSTLHEFIEKLPERAVLQELLEQHEKLKKLHPASINTARIVTVNTGTQVHIVATHLRVGVNNNFVDNIAKGNIYVPIDRNTGKLKKIGNSSTEPLLFLSHPQTKIVFEGYEIPFFHEAMELCQNLHYQLPYFFILGWDIAFTPKGVVVIETNNIHKMVDEQKAEGGLKKQIDAYFKEFMENKRKERKFDYA